MKRVLINETYVLNFYCKIVFCLVCYIQGYFILSPIFRNFYSPDNFPLILAKCVEKLQNKSFLNLLFNLFKLYGQRPDLILFN